MAEQANAANIKINRARKNTKKLVAKTACGNNFAKFQIFYFNSSQNFILKNKNFRKF